MMDIQHTSWVPPLLGLASVVCGYFSLELMSSGPGIQVLTNKGKRSLAVISVVRPRLGKLAIALAVLGLLFELVIELI